MAERTAASRRNGADGFRFTGKAIVDQAKEHGVLTLVMLFIMCGFGAACAVRAVSWLNARGYFIKLRSALTSNSGGGRHDGGGGRGDGSSSMDRTVSAHSLSPMSVHEYAELRRQADGGDGIGRPGHADGVRVFVYQDRGTQTVPEELTHEMLQTLRDKLDDPEDYAEARGMIEHLYDLIRVEESCCGGGVTWTSDGLDDATSTITTKAVQADGRGRPDVRSVGTDAPSLERLWPPRGANTVDGRRRHGPQPPPPRRPPPDRRWTGQPSVRDEYATPADYLRRGEGAAAAAAARVDDGGYGGHDGYDDDADAALYCELADLRPAAPPRDFGPRPAVSPPPVPDKPTLV